MPAYLALLLVTAVVLARVLPALLGLYQPAVPSAGVLAPPGPVVLGSWYELAFTEPGGPPGTRSDSPVERLLLGLIDRAQQTLDVAIYEIDLAPVADAMARAAARGVRVRMVTDTDTITNTRDPATGRALATIRAAGIAIVDDQRRQIMHHKFTVVDGRWVETGSWNYTFSETYRNNNHAIVMESPQLAANYTAEFEKMFVAHQFGPRKPRGVPYPTIDITGARVEDYFSPEDGGAAQIIRWIGSARQQVHFLAFAFTHAGIADAMLERARAGVEVAGVFEGSDANARGSQFPRLKQAGLGVALDANPWNMHHKVVLIDGHVAIFGSFNLSRSADRENDENLLIVDDPGLTAAFETEYQRIRAQAAGGGSR